MAFEVARNRGVKEPQVHPTYKQPDRIKTVTLIHPAADVLGWKVTGQYHDDNGRLVIMLRPQDSQNSEDSWNSRETRETRIDPVVLEEIIQERAEAIAEKKIKQATEAVTAFTAKMLATAPFPRDSALIGARGNGNGAGQGPGPAPVIARDGAGMRPPEVSRGSSRLPPEVQEELLERARKAHPSGQKPCGQCRVVKPLSEFAFWRTGKDGLQNRCRSC